MTADPARRSTLRTIVRYLVAGLAGAALVGAALVLTRSHHPADSTAAAAPAPVAALAPLPPGAAQCPPIYDSTPPLTDSATGTPFTSCGFAEEVRRAYRASPPDDAARVVEAASAVTRRSYEMTCRPTGTYVTCVGGGDAVVYLFDREP